VWLLQMAIAVGLVSVVGLAGFANIARAGDLISAAKSGGASDDAGSGRRSGAWANLWATPEQQAQRLLESQQPAKAAALFGDPRRRAYAELQAGQYEKAAQQLAPFKDVDSQYNRGNALAHAGKLQDALAAYDAALAQSPGNGDVSRNRELVARALEERNRAKQKPNGGNSQGDSQGGEGQPNSGQQGDGANTANGRKQDNANADGQSRADGQQQAGNQGQPGSQAQAANQAEAGKPGQSGNQAQPGGQAQSARQAQPGNQQQGNQAQAANSAPANQSAPGSGAQPNNGSPGSGNQAQDDLSEAARLAQRAKDADAGQRGAANSPDRDITVNKARASVDGTPQQPRSEQALALDQWLRGIPEDSGELLRRKFMIEHMMKQQGYQP
jgi:Ca-activated chloride channel homolog